VAEAGLCACGCGQATRPAPQNHAAKGWVRGRPMRVVKGHGVPKAMPGYEAAHVRVRTQRGSASEHACVRCGAPAQQWGLDPGAPSGNLRADSHTQLAGRIFSINVEDYRPVCSSCNQIEGTPRFQSGF
jgi:hypothetical protein